MSRVTSAEVLDEPIVRPEGLDLAAAWNDTVARLDGERATFAPWVEVLSPDEVRAELAERGAHLTRLYGAD